MIKTSAVLDLLLADDDLDDCLFFREVVEELFDYPHLTIVHNGVQLMDLLRAGASSVPDILFLDLNMPMKSGLECFYEIKQSPHLNQLPIVIISTSLDINVVNELFELGADYYIRKPGGFPELKKVIWEAIARISERQAKNSSRDQFIIQT